LWGWCPLGAHLLAECGGSVVRLRRSFSSSCSIVSSRGDISADIGVDTPDRAKIAPDSVGGRGYDRGAPAGGLEGRAQVTSMGFPGLMRHGARAVAAGRVALGLTALVWPSVPARPWVGGAADELGARVFGRALGARDLALGLGALAALQGSDNGSASAWVAAGALSDALDVVASVASWRELPRVGRWLVVGSAGGAALAGAAGALAVRPGRNGAAT